MNPCTTGATRTPAQSRGPAVARRVAALGLTAALGLFGLNLTACNTTEGLGEDVESAGDALEDAADDAND